MAQQTISADTLRVVIAQDRFIDAMAGRFVRQATRIISEASTATVAELQSRLEIKDGQIAQTPANQVVLRQTQAIFLGHLRRLGYGRTVGAFVAQFPRQLPFFERTLGAISATLRDSFDVSGFGPKDFAFFDSHQISSARILQGLPQRIASQAQEQVLLATGALPVRNLVGVLSRRFGVLPLQAETLAATAMATHYRVIQDRGYQVIERESGPLRYIYGGPIDLLNRPFCESVLKRNPPRTRKQINQLDNRSPLKPTFTAAGGHNCRHGWFPLPPRTRRN